jgi:hypothetical protein
MANKIWMIILIFGIWIIIGAVSFMIFNNSGNQEEDAMEESCLKYSQAIVDFSSCRNDEVNKYLVELQNKLRPAIISNDWEGVIYTMDKIDRGKEILISPKCEGIKYP